MILSLVLDTFLIPLFVATSLSYIFDRVFNKRISPSTVAVMAWLPLYVWINHSFNFPPKQSLDWLWIYALCTSFRVFAELRKAHVVMIYQCAVFLFICIVIAWPAISYNPSLSSHWLIWLETLSFLSIGTYFIVRLVNPKIVFNQRLFSLGNIYLWLITGALGLSVIMTGSLLIGTLLVSLSSCYLAISLYSKFFSISKKPHTIRSLCLPYGLVLIILLISRIYVEVNFVITALFLTSILLSVYLVLNQHFIFFKQHLIQCSILACLGIAVGLSFYFEVLNHSNSMY